MSEPTTTPAPTAPIVLTRRKLFLILAGFGLFAGIVGGTAAWAGGAMFSDVPPTHPFYSQIQWAGNAGVVGGFPDGTFRPGNTVTRQAAVAFLANYNNTLHLVHQFDNPGPAAEFSVIVVCDPGWRALAGGGTTNLGDLFMTDSSVTTDVTQGDSWFVRWESDNDALVDPGSAEAWVLCAPPLS